VSAETPGSDRDDTEALATGGSARTDELMKPGYEEKFWQRVNKTPYCWIWTAGIRSTGYGAFYNGYRHTSAHRSAYELLVGPIPEGMVLDHLCKTRICVNPDHLVPVSNRENVLRGDGPTALNAIKTHCNQGHAYTPENTYNRPGGKGRTCLTCRREWDKRRRTA
jgi:hypothetical protein